MLSSAADGCASNSYGASFNRSSKNEMLSSESCHLYWPVSVITSSFMAELVNVAEVVDGACEAGPGKNTIV